MLVCVCLCVSVLVCACVYAFSFQLFEDSGPVRTEKAMGTHSSILAWQIQWMEEPGGLQSMGLLGVGHN